MALETVPKDLRHLRACLLCSLVKVSVRDGRGLRESKLEGKRMVERGLEAWRKKARCLQDLESG